MNQSTQRGAPRRTRVLASQPVAPISRAIRAALAVSATMLTLFAPAASWAADSGTCSYDAVSNTYACNGDFSQPIADAGFIPPADLTVVLGDQLPSSVHPDAGYIGIDAAWAGDISILVNAGSSIQTAGADGIHAYGSDATTRVSNYGSIATAVTAEDAEAMDIGGVHDVTVVNGGSVLASDADGGHDVIGASVFSDYGSVQFDNLAGAVIGASAYDGSATALLAASQGYYGQLAISNAGVINADSIHGDASGIVASAASQGYANIQNSGSVQASGYASAVGIEAYGEYSSTVDNSGDVGAAASAAGGATAYGVSNLSYHLSYLYNDAPGTITATAHAGYGGAVAVGAYVVGGDVSTLHNDGSITASAKSDFGSAQAYGAVVEGYSGVGLLISGGDVDASTVAGIGGYAQATGDLVVAAVASIFNDGNASATATAGAAGVAIATGLHAEGTNTAINSYGDVSATAKAVGGAASATGTYAYGHSGSASFYNTGDISAQASAYAGVAEATGVNSIGIYNAYATNLGTISATASGAQATAAGVVNQSYFEAATSNAGRITVTASGTVAPYGQYEAVAVGVYTFATIYDAIVDNSGSVSVTSSALADIDDTGGFLVAKAIGVRAVNPAGYGEALVTNTGDVGASAVTGQGYASAWGAIAQSGSYGYGQAEIDNDGSIASSAQSGAGNSVTIGAYAHSGSTAIIVNHGDISATSQAGRGIPYVSLATAYATGAQVYGFAYGGGEASISNDGSIEADASLAGGIVAATALKTFGSSSTVDNAAGATIAATAEATLFGGVGAVAVEAGGLYGVAVANDGNISAYARAHAYADGVHDYYGASRAMAVEAIANYRGNVSVVNHGDIAAHAVAENGITFFNAGAGATGVSTYAKYAATVENAGDISAVAESELGIVGAYGVMGRGKYYTHVANDAGSSIVASASTASLASDQYGGRAVSFGTHVFGTDHGVTYNAGSIVSHAVVTADGGENEGRSLASAWGSAVGAYSSIQTGEVVNVGDIEAAASADFGYANAFGTYVLSHYDSSTSNAGSIQSTARSDHGHAFAVGSYAFALHQQYHVDCDENGYCDYSNPTFTPDAGTASLDNSGGIMAVATAQGGSGQSYGASVLGAFVSGITNSGHIGASADADDARAVGALTNSVYGYSTVQNSGSFEAIASGGTASASGVFAAGAYGNADNGQFAATIDNQGSILARATGTTTATAIGIESVGWKDAGIRIDNGGTIGAAAYGADATATAVSMDARGANVLTNTGSIAAYGDGTRIAVSSGIGATATIANQGSMVGAVVTGDLDDSFDNAAGASWQAIGSSDFGAGDDHVVNRGTLFMADASISLGGYVNGNTFDNFGTISVSGATNLIDMDNPFPVSNNGVISFVDGAPDDVLTVAGDFAGQGSLDVDVSGLHQTGDRLYVDGNVIDSTRQVINVNLIDMPTTPTVDIPLVIASGTRGGSFTLGQTQSQARGFVALDFGLKTAGGTTSLVMDVTGLNAAGSLASALTPGAQSLVNAEVGTWRQRMGVVPEQGKRGLAPWVRTFSDSGDIRPGSSSNFGASGNAAFHQTNRGLEFGLDTRLSDHLSAGVLIGKSDGSQRMADGSGSDRLDGRTFGLYGTWMADNSFYFDVSQRWTGIKAHLRSGMVATTTDADAAVFNVEAGVTAWTLAGVHVMPQLQYTRTRIEGISSLHLQQSDFVDHGGVSSRGRAGLAFDKTIQGARFSWTPYGSVNAVREFRGNHSYAINGGLLGATSTRGTSAMVELGLGARRGGLSLTGGVNWTDGGALQNVLGGQLAVRYSW
ncbi:hypothetical protein ABNK63_01750 [Rhodanobacter sp. IGA1.0]|uniref:Autotransporter domain-containing protein n=1 Tax=Rhodanobacter sp. IGA1.0 TaxID=3158582 RepID=A0AAU7QLL6_9GAMM